MSKRNFKKSIVLFIVLTLFILMFTGCSSSGSQTSVSAPYDAEMSVASGSNSFKPSSSKSSLSMTDSYYNGGEGYDYSFDNTESSNNESVEIDDQKLVYTSTLDIETKEMNDALETVYSLINQYNGIIQTKRLNDVDSVYYDDYFYDTYNYSHRTGSRAYIYVRIPQKNYENFMNSLYNDGNNLYVTDTNEVIENMTDTYYDLENRLRTLYAEKDRLYDFLNQAQTVSEMLEIERRLTDVLYSIESVTNSRTTIDNDVAYAKVTLNIKEVLKYTETVGIQKTLFERIKLYISDSASTFGDTLENLLRAIIYLTPHVILIGIVIFVIIKIIKVYRKKHPKKVKKIPNWGVPMNEVNNMHDISPKIILTKDEEKSDFVIGETESGDSN